VKREKGDKHIAVIAGLDPAIHPFKRLF